MKKNKKGIKIKPTTKTNFNPETGSTGIMEKGKIYELTDDGMYQIWTAGGTVHRKKVLDIEF